MARRRRGTSSSRGPKNNRWVNLVVEQDSFSTTPVESNLVQKSDWQTSTAAFEKATLLRVRGWLSMSIDGTIATDATVFGMIYVVDEDAGVQDASDPATYADEDILWTGGHYFGPGDTASIERAQSYDTVIDIKSMRKIHTGMQVRLSLVTDVAVNCISSFAIRSLLRIGGN